MRTQTAAPSSGDLAIGAVAAGLELLAVNTYGAALAAAGAGAWERCHRPLPSSPPPFRAIIKQRWTPGTVCSPPAARALSLPRRCRP